MCKTIGHVTLSHLIKGELLIGAASSAKSGTFGHSGINTNCRLSSRDSTGSEWTVVILCESVSARAPALNGHCEFKEPDDLQTFHELMNIHKS